jgi:hypothetical protein
MYTFPFLVKAFCRGLFNVDMGAITNFSVQRGGQDNMLWSFKGAAEIISVDFEITPLINNLVMTSTLDGPGWVLANKGLQEYMSSIAAFDARNDQYDLALDLFEAMLANGISAKISGIANPLSQSEFVSGIREIVQRVAQTGGPKQLLENAAGAIVGGITGGFTNASELTDEQREAESKLYVDSSGIDYANYFGVN